MITVRFMACSVCTSPVRTVIFFTPYFLHSELDTNRASPLWSFWQMIPMISTLDTSNIMDLVNLLYLFFVNVLRPDIRQLEHA